MLVEGFLSLVVTFIFALVLFLIYSEEFNTRKSVPSNFPPGPSNSIIQSFYLSGSNLLTGIQKLREKFGDIIGLQFGKKNVVVISNYELIQEAQSIPELCGSHVTDAETLLSSSSSLVNSIERKDRRRILEGSTENPTDRKFILKILRDFGFGEKTLESLIMDDVLELLTWMKTQEGLITIPHASIQISVFNALIRFITSEKLSHADPQLERLWKSFESIITATEKIEIPSLLSRFLPNGFTANNQVQMEVAVKRIEKYLRSKIEEHKAVFDESSGDVFGYRDFMDAYLQEIRDTKDKKSCFFGDLGELNLLIASLHLISGSNKTSTTILWALYHLAQNQSIQKKLHKEIDRHIGIYRQPLIKDKLRMPYTEALMLETFRVSSLSSPFGVPLNSTAEITFHGYQIPEDTLILMNLHDVHHDSQHWKDPSTFRPERFLSKDEKEVIKAHRPVIWSTIGKRTLPNELLRSDNFFLFITSIFQRFHLTLVEEPRILEPGEELPTFAVRIGDRIDFLYRKEKDLDE